MVYSFSRTKVGKLFLYGQFSVFLIAFQHVDGPGVLTAILSPFPPNHFSICDAGAELFVILNSI